MELRLPVVHAYVLNPSLDFEEAKQQAVDKRLSIVAGGLSGLFSRPKPEEVDLAYGEFRYEASWHLACTVRFGAFFQTWPRTLWSDCDSPLPAGDGRAPIERAGFVCEDGFWLGPEVTGWSATP